MGTDKSTTIRIDVGVLARAEAEAKRRRMATGELVTARQVIEEATLKVCRPKRTRTKGGK